MPDLIVGAKEDRLWQLVMVQMKIIWVQTLLRLKSMTNKITYLDDGEFCIIKKDQVLLMMKVKKLIKKILELSSDEASYDKGDSTFHGCRNERTTITKNWN